MSHQSDLARSTVKGLVENITSLGALQAANYILPLVTVPYLVRVVGVDQYGLIAFAQAFMQYFIILTDFGFNLWATKEIASHRDDHERVRSIFSSVMTVRILLMVLGLVMLFGLTALIPRLREEMTLFLLSYGLVFGNVLFPVWFFQGMERMKQSTGLLLLARLIFVALIFLVVHEPGDYLFVPALNSIGMIIGGLISLVMISRYFDIRFALPKMSEVRSATKSSFQYFAATASSSVFASFNTMILGFVTTNEIVGLYAAAEKLFIALRGLFHPIATALYPYMSATRNLKLYRKIFFATVSGSVVLAALVWLTAEISVPIVFGEAYPLTIKLLKIFAGIVPISAASLLIGYPLLAALGREKLANYSNIAGAFVHIGLVLSLYKFISPELVVYLLLSVESCVLIIKLSGSLKYKLWTAPR